jgi:beta-N-acetylhexosaminidase
MHPIMLDVAAYELSSQECEILKHPLVGGVILFARNYFDPQQLQHLTQQIRTACPHDILIAVDQEGGRVQRFTDGFTKIPALRTIKNTAKPEQLAYACGMVIATECLSRGVDLTFAPVLDLDGISEVIQCRSFSDDPKQVLSLASAFIKGLNSLNMGAIGKHFPGHGNVLADSHIAMPIDPRPAEEIFSNDMAIFTQLMSANRLAGIMPAHVVYPQVDELPAGFSQTWLQSIIRQRYAFSGVIFSDDLSMHAATQGGSMLERVQMALTAGCDMALICNNQNEAVHVLDNLGHTKEHLSSYSNKVKQLLANNLLYDKSISGNDTYKTSVKYIQSNGIY